MIVGKVHFYRQILKMLILKTKAGNFGSDDASLGQTLVGLCGCDSGCLVLFGRETPEGGLQNLPQD